jgi:hypothetical protein
VTVWRKKRATWASVRAEQDVSGEGFGLRGADGFGADPRRGGGQGGLRPLAGAFPLRPARLARRIRSASDLAIETKYAMWSRPTDLAILSSLVSVPATKRAVSVGLLGSLGRGGGAGIAQAALRSSCRSILDVNRFDSTQALVLRRGVAFA